MREKTFWATILRPKLSPYGHLERIESETRLGIPDVNYCLVGREGWWETKYLPSWPRPNSIVRFRHFTIEQLQWALTRHRAGGRAGLMARIDRDYLFFDPPAMEAIYNGVKRPELERLAMVRASHVFPTAPMVKALIRKI